MAARRSLNTIILVIFKFMIKSKAIVNPYGPTVVSDYTHCINQIIENEFQKSGLLLFANTDNVSTSVSRIRTELLKKIHEEIKYSVEVISPGKEVEICDQDNNDFGVLHVDHFVAIPVANYFIIIIDSFKDFSYLASKLIRSRSWNPYAKFIILLFNLTQNDKINIQNVENVLSCLFKYNALNIVIIVPEAKQFRNAIIYSWRPFDPPKYCGYFNETAKDRLIIQNMCESGMLKYDKNVFESKIPRDMNGCVLKILAMHRQPFISDNQYDANIEKVMINEMLSGFKISAAYHLIDGFRGERENVGEWNGALKKLVTKEGHVLLGGIFPDFDVHEDFESSITYLADAYTWVVPRAHKSAAWVGLVIIFKNLVWYSVIAGFFLCAIAWKSIGQISEDSVYNSSFDHCFINTWITILGFVSYLHPVKESLRVFFVFFNIYCILFLTAYQTKLFDVLTNPSFEYQIQSIEELVDSGLKFGGFEVLHDLFYNSTDPFDYYIGEQWTDVDNITQAMIDVAVHRNFSLLCSRLELAHISAITPELSDSTGAYRYYEFEQDTFTVPIEMTALRGFPFMKEFSKTITLFKQNGFNEALRHKFATFNERRRARLLRTLLREKVDVNPLSGQHLQGGFLALALGYVSGVLVLIVEITINSRYVRKQFALLRRKFN